MPTRHGHSLGWRPVRAARVGTRLAPFWSVRCFSLLYFVLTIIAGASGRVGLAVGALTLSLVTAMIGFGRGTNATLGRA